MAASEFHSISDFNSFDKAINWLERHEPQCARVVKENQEHLQDFRAIKNYATECKQVFSASRWGITGEAGFFHDPFYSPGSDFIAFSNTFLTDLIWRDMTWRGHRIRSFSYDRIFKRFYYGTLSAYQDQYKLFGNPTVMPVKILWDYLVYWSITAFIFMHGRMCMHGTYLRNLKNLNRFGKLNHFMQNLFREWHETSKQDEVSSNVNISQMPIIREMNEGLKKQLRGTEFHQQFSRNLETLEEIALEIYRQSGCRDAFPLASGRDSGMTAKFEEVLKS